jgi:serine/threonine protein kinase
MGKLFKSIADVIPVKSKGTDSLGEGSFAKVKMVTTRDNPNKCYAMKTIQTRTERERQQVLKEISLHMTLVHENIIRFEDFIDGKKEMYIFIELARNGDLFSHINRVKCSDTELTRFFYQTCRAIQYMHKKSLMHRDLKPENILLDSGFNIKVCDFGWSTEFLESVPRETLCGTFEYMAPEVLLRKRQSTKTDVWALGILLYELFHGNAPFRGRRLEEVLEQISRNTLAFKKTLNPLIKDLIVRILKFYPHERPTVDQILESEFIQEFMNGMQTQREARSSSPNSVPTVYTQQGCFLKAKDAKVESFFEVGSQIADQSNDAVKSQPFFNIYLERQPIETGTVATNRVLKITSQSRIKTEGSTSDLFRSFNQGPTTPSKTNIQGLNQPSLSNLSAHKPSYPDIDKDQRSNISISAQTTPQKTHYTSTSQQPTRPLNQIATQLFHPKVLAPPAKEPTKINPKTAASALNRSPQSNPAVESSQRYQSSGPDRNLATSFKVNSTKGFDLSNRSTEDSANLGGLKKVQSSANIQIKSINKNSSEQLKSFLNAPALSTSFSQHCLSVAPKQETSTNRIYKLNDITASTQPALNQSANNPAITKSSMPAATFYNASTRMVTAPNISPKAKPGTDQNRPHPPMSPHTPQKNPSANPNPIFRRIASTEKSFANYFTTFQKLN